MIVSWNWLSQYVRLDLPVDALTDRLALTGLNHESTSEVGGDLAIDLEVTSNRADCLCHLGVAREVAVILGDRRATEPPARPVATGPLVSGLTSVVVETPDSCPHFTARVVTGARIQESPWWLKKRLETLGVRPVSNVVDITNYVMFECGQPLHAYDLDRLAGRRLVVRPARAGEKLVAINGKTYELTPEMLAIADAERAVGLAGVMGGLDTEIGPATTEILIEAARFDPMSVRRTSRALGLLSASSYRFERPLDPTRTEWASRRCAELILELAGGTLHEGLIEVGNGTPPERPAVVLRFAEIERVLGIAVPAGRVVAILQDLGLEALDGGEGWRKFRSPSWRSDLDREIDLIEEVARVHGYEHIPEDRAVPLVGSTRSVRERVESAAREALTALGHDEACTFSLVGDDLVVPMDPAPVAMPLRAEHSTRRRENILRPSLVPSLLAARAYNEAHGTPDASFFEIANVYPTREGRVLPDERTRIGLVGGGDFFDAKGTVETLLDRLHVTAELEARSVSIAPFAPGRAAELRLAGAFLGYVGEVGHPLRDRLGLRERSTAAELELAPLLEHAMLVPQEAPVPAYPPVARDLSLVVDRTLPWAEVAEAAKGAAGPSLESIRFLDAFEGGNVPLGQQSLHFGLVFRRSDRTLTGEEVDAAVNQVVEVCRARFDAALRS